MSGWQHTVSSFNIRKLLITFRHYSCHSFLALDLFDNISALCGTVYDHCTPVTCSYMSFPGCPKTYWLDEKGKRHQYAAGRYIDCVMSFIEAARKEAIFPTKYG